jgi:hypothetical protein
MNYSNRPSRPRRTRFTVTFSDGDKGVILAFPGQEQAIVDHYNRLGKAVLRVDKGDHVHVKPEGGFTVDQAALRDAIALLDLKVPVRIRYNSRAGRTNGNYRRRATHHDIMLKSYLTPEEASSTLWHELTHAMQAERAGSREDWGQVILAQKRYSYSMRPVEVEARQMSHDMRDCPLAR